ncbi:MAG: HAMP domain-containing sensor histidine kinase [Acidobacteriota bacterium]
MKVWPPRELGATAGPTGAAEHTERAATNAIVSFFRRASAPRHSPVRHRRFLRPAGHAVAGFAFGYGVLHPVAMLIFGWLDPRLAAGMGAHTGRLWSHLALSFQPDMLLMGLVFGLFSGLIAGVNGYYQGELEMQAELLRRQNNRLSRLERDKRRHTQFMVHDFKGHLQSILAFSGLLLEKADPKANPAAYDALARIRRQAHKMIGAVMDLLDLARLQESPRIMPELVPVGVLLRDASTDIGLPTHLGSVEIGAQAERSGSILVDPRLLGRVLVNLVTNALRHNRPGTRVVLDAERDTSGAVVISCSDDGQGLPDEVRASLFEESAGGTARHDRQSTGLGLAFCKAAVEAHGGRICCISTPGQGARFEITIPGEREKES